MLVEASGVKASTGVLGLFEDTVASRKEQQQLAHAVYIDTCNAAIRRAHKLPRTSTIPFSEHAEWYRTNVLPERRGGEREGAALTLLIQFFGDADVLTITPARATEYTTWRRTHTKRLPQGAASSTINREVAVLKSLMKAAVPEHLAASPLHGRKLLRIVKRKKRLLEPEEETRLLAALTPADRALYVVALDSLIRLSNVLDLRRDEDHGTHFALTDSKTGPYEAIISGRVRTALDALPDEGEYYFQHRRGAKTARDRRGVVRRMLQRACAKCDPPIPYGRAVGGITFHTGTRATGATRMLRAGHDAKTVQAVGNWHDMRSMADYLETSRALMKAAVEDIGSPRDGGVIDGAVKPRKPQ